MRIIIHINSNNISNSELYNNLNKNLHNLNEPSNKETNLNVSEQTSKDKNSNIYFSTIESKDIYFINY